MTGKPINLVLVLGTLASLVLCPATSAQGAFQNLNFESVILPWVVQDNIFAPAANAVAGWKTYWCPSVAGQVLLNATTLDAAAVSLQDTNSRYYKPIQGNYSLTLRRDIALAAYEN